MTELIMHVVVVNNNQMNCYLKVNHLNISIAALKSPEIITCFLSIYLTTVKLFVFVVLNFLHQASPTDLSMCHSERLLARTHNYTEFVYHMGSYDDGALQKMQQQRIRMDRSICGY